MSSFSNIFEAMMAGITAPPLSLYEFRHYIAHDPKARNALAFCEWYQRYKTVYFDCIGANSNGATATGFRPELTEHITSSARKNKSQSNAAGKQAEYAPSRTSFSVPYLSTRVYGDLPFGAVHTLKSHSFSALSDSVMDSAFYTATNTTSTGNSSIGGKRLPLGMQTESWHPNIYSLNLVNTRLDRDQHAGLDACAADLVLASSISTMVRRRTIPHVPSKSWLEHGAYEQEKNRLQIQSLLVFECWARFLSPHAPEEIEVPESELFYIQERLPLNITHIPQPLLCRNDMLVSAASVVEPAGHVSGTSKENMQVPGKGPGSTEAVILPKPALCRSLQIEPCKQLKQRLMSRVNIRHLDVSLTHSPISLGFGVDNTDAEFSFAYNKSGAGDDSVKQFIASLRRTSTMPALNLRGAISNTINESDPQLVDRRIPVQHPMRLIPVSELQLYHQVLRPRPPFPSLSANVPTSSHTCGYKPLPASVSKLISKNAVPPAVFETAAKVSADYLLQNHFATFFCEARYNTTKRERLTMLVAATIALLSGLGIAAALVVLVSSKAWRVLSLPLIFASPALYCTAWTRVSIWRWWHCSRTTSLIFRHCRPNMEAAEEKSTQTAGQSASSRLHAIRKLTGTFSPPNIYGCSGPIFGTSCHMYGSTYFGTLDGYPSSIDNYPATPLSQPKYRSSTIERAIDDVVGYILCKCNPEDRWNINLDKKWYTIAEPVVIRVQCYVVVHQLTVSAILCVISAIILLLLPSN